MWRWWGGLNLILSLVAGLLAPWPALETAPWLVAWLAGLLFLEQTAPELPLWGVFRTQTAWTIGVLGPLGLAGPALGLWYAGLTLYQKRARETVLLEWSAGLIILTVVALLAPLPQPELRWWLAGTAGLLALTHWQRRLAWRRLGHEYSSWLRLEGTVATLRWVAGAAALLTLVTPGPARLLLAPILYGLQLGAGNAIFRVQARIAQASYAQSLEISEHLQQALSDNFEQARFERVDALLRRATTLQQAGQELLAPLQQRLHLQTVGVLWSSQGRQGDLVLVAAQGPGAANLERPGPLPAVFSEALRLRQARLCRPPLVDHETAGVVVPAGRLCLYLGREVAWTESEFSWLGSFMRRCLPHVEARGDSAALRQKLEGQQALLECSWRFGQHLETGPLWAEVLEWFTGVLPLQGAALADPQQVLVHGQLSRGELELLTPFLPSAGTLYLAGANRARWPLRLGLENLLGFDIPQANLQLVLSFAGEETVTASQLEVLRGVCDLLGTAWARARSCESLNQSRNMWLATHKSLALAQLSAGLAHELNSPLGAIQLALEASLRQAPDPRLQAALEGCSRARGIIARLSQEADKRGQELASQDLVQCTRLLLAQLEPTVSRLGVQTTLECPSQLVCQLSREDLESLLMPLLLNSLEALAEVPTARRLHVVVGPGPSWTVHDNGPGIPAEIGSRILEPFFTTRAVGKNVGLGLAMVAQTCQRVGARLEFASQPGHDTWFCLRLPG